MTRFQRADPLTDLGPRRAMLGAFCLPTIVRQADRLRYSGPGLMRAIVMLVHSDRGVETPAFRPGRNRGVSSPEMPTVSDSVFACPGTGCSPRPPRKRCCGTTART